MIKYFKLKYIITFLTSIILLGCGSGTPRGINSDTYGNLLSYKQITLGGSESTVTTTTTTLQALGKSFWCPSVTETAILADTETLDRSNTHYGTDLCNANESYVETTESTTFGNIKLSSFVTDNPLKINSVKMYQITFDTPGQAYYYSGGTTSKETVSGLVIVPEVTSQESILGIVLYYHPTTFSKSNVPSMQDTYSQAMLASIYAAQGYIVIAPDYVGQGIDSSVMHPYVLYTETNALSGINMLTASRQFLSQQNIVNNETLPINKELNLYVTSYSEGGAYALWASRLLQGNSANVLVDNNLKLKLTVGIEGAYDLSQTMIPYAYDNSNNAEEVENTYKASPGMLESSTYYLNGGSYSFLGRTLNVESGLQQTSANLAMSISKAALASYAFVAFITYNYTAAAYPLFFPNNAFLNNKTCLDVGTYFGSLLTGETPYESMAISCPIQDTLPNLFMTANNTNYSDSNIALTIAQSAMWNTNFFTGGQESPTLLDKKIFDTGVGNSSISSFAQPVLSDPFLMEIIRKGDTWSYVTNSPTSLISLNYDSTVPGINTEKACSSTGVYGLSPNGMVNCLWVDSTKLFTASTLISTGSFDVQLPLMIDHGSAFYILNLIALNQIKQNQ